MHNQNKIFRVLQLISILKTKPAKSMRQIANTIGSTERTVYRYLDLLSEVGFYIEKNETNKVYIESDSNDNRQQFNQEEVLLLKQLILTVGKKSKLKDTILKKLYINSDIQINSNHLLKAHLGKIIESLAAAILNKKQVVLKKYHSINSNNITNRLVEPISFTDNYQSLVAYEVKTGENKYFNVERITSVEISKNNFKHKAKHKFEVPDVFGFSKTKKEHTIELLLSLRAATLLREEYPMSAPLIKFDKKKKLYQFKVKVNDLKPITRFTLGILDEITLIGSKEFIDHLKKHIEKLFKSN